MKTDSEENVFCTTCNINYSKSKSDVHSCNYHSYFNEFENKLKKNNENFSNIKKSQCNFVELMREAKDDFKHKYNEIISTLTLINQINISNIKVEGDESPASLKNTLIINSNKTDEAYLLNDNFCKALIEWIGKEVRFDLIFRATRDGWLGSDFHKLCDKVGPTVMVIRNNQDKLFGCYTSLNLGEGVGYRTDDTLTGFVFSLSLMQKCPLRVSNKSKVFYDDNNYFPTFGCTINAEIDESDESDRTNNQKITYSDDLLNFTYEFIGDQDAFYGSYQWKIEEYEVYRVIDN